MAPKKRTFCHTAWPPCQHRTYSQKLSACIAEAESMRADSAACGHNCCSAQIRHADPILALWDSMRDLQHQNHAIRMLDTPEPES
eukprot:1155443-Pelagomonas_calceolata.AAC.5